MHHFRLFLFTDIILAPPSPRPSPSNKSCVRSLAPRHANDLRTILGRACSGLHCTTVDSAVQYSRAVHHGKVEQQSRYSRVWQGSSPLTSRRFDMFNVYGADIAHTAETALVSKGGQSHYWAVLSSVCSVSVVWCGVCSMCIVRNVRSVCSVCVILCMCVLCM